MSKSKIIKLNKTKKLRLFLLQPLKFSRLAVIIFGIIFIFFLLFIVLDFLFLIDLKLPFRKDLVNFQNHNDQKINVLVDSPSNLNATKKLNNLSVNLFELVENLISLSDLSSSSVETLAVADNSNPSLETLNSFGDHFSGLSYIDLSRLTMNWDKNTTAFTFPPLYNFEKISAGTNFADSENLTGFTPYLKVAGKELYYRDKKINLPFDLAAENILRINVNLIGKRWLIGIVTGHDYDERGWVYFYDGEKKIFTPLITKTSANRIEPRFSRLGGAIAFGGETDDFLIVYGGYDGRAFYYYKGVLSDVSRFFSLRVSDGGFMPQIVSAKNSRGTVFYLCSATENKPKFIKIWPQKSGELIGSLDFSPLIFTGSLSTVSTVCKIDTDSANGLKVLLNFKKNDDFNSNNNNFETWRFNDNGFDNSRDREVVSFDLGQNRGKKITSAIISAIGIFSDPLTVELFFANANNNWQKISPSEWVVFKTPTNSLFWRATFKAEPSDSAYSPWFDHINSLDYKAK